MPNVHSSLLKLTLVCSENEVNECSTRIYCITKNMTGPTVTNVTAAKMKKRVHPSLPLSPCCSPPVLYSFGKIHLPNIVGLHVMNKFVKSQCKKNYLSMKN